MTNQRFYALPQLPSTPPSFNQGVNKRGRLYVSIQKSMTLSAADFVEILPDNPSRHSALFINDGSTVIYLFRLSGGGVNKGIRLNPAGGSFQEEMDTRGDIFTGSWFAQPASGSPVILVTELSHAF
jgi:hypothetical protein